ncbi:glycosyltransferase [Paraburkholderia sp. CI3]|uniref:glycosyltransferase n=1 Tax=Paraburkholderia sp. CI3 TaxID=2991060 RepID=UPI003D1ACBF9
MSKSAYELLAANGDTFIREAYRTLLCREPDDSGMTHYRARLDAGVSKAQILADLRLSKEGLAESANVDGLDDIVAFHKFRSFWPMKYLTRLLGTPGAFSARSTVRHVMPAPIASTAEMLAIPEPAPVQQATQAPVALQPVAPRIPVPEVSPRKEPVFWMDLTATMEWTGGVVGVIRAELEIANGLKKVNPDMRFSMQRGCGFIEISQASLNWLFEADNVAEAYVQTVDRIQSADGQTASSLSMADTLQLVAPSDVPLFHPYIEGDVIFTCGWITSQKEFHFTQLKGVCPRLYISYLVYDVILLREATRHLYDKLTRERFEQYLKWVSDNVDFTVFGGETALKDTHAIQTEREWRQPESAAVKFGSDIVKITNTANDAEILKEIGITGPFLITVGSIEQRKNHDTLYRAYLMALEMDPKRVPQLVICGKPWHAEDLTDTLDRDPRLKGVMIRFSPTDEQLAALYRNCLFTVLPSLYEGWSLTLPESLGQGKFCLASDNAPLREVGRDLIDYVPAWDVATWAEKILHYAHDRSALEKYELRIAREWTNTTWLDTANMIYTKVSEYAKTHAPREPEPSVWMDLTTTYLYWHGGVQGIIRAELTYARYLQQLTPNAHFFACHNGLMFEIPHANLQWLFNEDDLATAYGTFDKFYREHETAGTGCRHPFADGEYPDHPAVLREFPENAIVFFAAIDWYPEHERARTFQAIKMARSKRSVTTSQLIYDFTPMLIPHHHLKETAERYEPFIKFSSENFDHLIYGGQTAKRDGIAFQKAHGWPIPASDYVEFGSDISESDIARVITSEANDKQVLERLGVGPRFIMTVGTLQPRKNQEMLYKAYITMLESGEGDKLPQMLFIGGKGWKSDDFLAILQEDSRVRGRILMLRPTDAELNVLYRHCMFTLLPSFYEGWSLTLPESLSYGKFCLTADCAPLRETGRDLVEYINPLDTYRWADRIAHYARHPEEVAAWETRIWSGWKPRSWKESTEMLLTSLRAVHQKRLITARLELSKS